jgi:hypothetical protein
MGGAANLKPNCAGSHHNSSFVPSGETIVTLRMFPRATAVSFARIGHAKFMLRQGL